MALPTNMRECISIRGRLKNSNCLPTPLAHYVNSVSYPKIYPEGMNCMTLQSNRLIIDQLLTVFNQWYTQPRQPWFIHVGV